LFLLRADYECRYIKGLKEKRKGFKYFSGTHWTGGWVGPRAGLYDNEKRRSLIYREVHTNAEYNTSMEKTTSKKKRVWDNNIKTHLIEMGYVSMKWINFAQEVAQ
jgi:hypothetical protein